MKTKVITVLGALLLVCFMPFGIAQTTEPWAPGPGAWEPINVVEYYEHMFVAFVTDAHYEEDINTPCGVVYGNYQVVEKLKGDPDSVPNRLKLVLRSCESPSSFNRGFPVGSYVLISSNGEEPELIWFTMKINYTEGQTCFVDRFREVLGIEHEDSERCWKEREALMDRQR